MLRAWAGNLSAPTAWAGDRGPCYEWPRWGLMDLCSPDRLLCMDLKKNKKSIREMLLGQRKHKTLNSKLPALLHPLWCYPHVEPHFPASPAAPCNGQVEETLQVPTNLSKIWISPNHSAGLAKYHSDLNLSWTKVPVAEVRGVTLPWQGECSTFFASLQQIEWSRNGPAQDLIP